MKYPATNQRFITPWVGIIFFAPLVVYGCAVYILEIFLVGEIQYDPDLLKGVILGQLESGNLADEIFFSYQLAALCFVFYVVCLSTVIITVTMFISDTSKQYSERRVAIFGTLIAVSMIVAAAIAVHVQEKPDYIVQTLIDRILSILNGRLEGQKDWMDKWSFVRDLIFWNTFIGVLISGILAASISLTAGSWRGALEYEIGAQRKRLMNLNILLHLSAVFFVSSIASTNAILTTTLAYVDEAQLSVFIKLKAGYFVFWGIAYSIILISSFAPAYYVAVRRCDSLAELLNPGKTWNEMEDWKTANGLKISRVQNLLRIVSVLSPIAVGSGIDLSALTGG